MAAFTCPTCNSETNKLIYPRDIVAYPNTVCPSCYDSKPMSTPNLHQNISTSKGTRLTSGKAWEIDNRRICPDDKTKVINVSTGRETEY